jgi:hypothetical protein
MSWTVRRARSEELLDSNHTERCPVVASTTPSSEMNSPATIFLIAFPAPSVGMPPRSVTGASSPGSGGGRVDDVGACGRPDVARGLVGRGGVVLLRSVGPS